VVTDRSLGRQFGWLWASYTVSTFGTWLGFGAFPLIAILVLHAGPIEVSLLSAAGSAIGAVVAVPLGPWVEFHRKRPVMVAVVGPPLGNAAIGLFGPVVTVAVDAVSYLLSALSIRSIGGREQRPDRTDGARLKAGELLDGWRYILAHPALRPLFFNTVLVNGLIMANLPLLAVLMLDQLMFEPWQYGLAFGAPCIGGLIGSRLARPLVTRFGQRRTLLTAGALRACWPLGLTFVGPGTSGLVLVIAIQWGLVTCMGVFNPVFATYRLDQTRTTRVVRTLSAWSVTSNATIAALTALWGLLATATSLRTAIAIAGLLILTTPLLLPRRGRCKKREPVPSRT